MNPTVPVLWAARGGYGAGRLLPILERMTKEHGVPTRKLLVGYSDVTVLHEFVRSRWSWATLHAPMPAAANFSEIAAPEWQALCGHCGAFDTIGWGHPGRDGMEPGHRPLPAFGAALLAAP